MSQREFIESDPWEGQWADVYRTDTRTPWDDIYRSMYLPGRPAASELLDVATLCTRWLIVWEGSWVEIPNAEASGLTGGLPLSKWFETSLWHPKSEGYVPSFLHQLHCLVSLTLARG